MASVLTKPLLAWVRHFQTREPAKIISLPREVFGTPIRPDLIQRCVVWYRAAIRAGTASTKRRGEVAGSSRKIRQQKGTGRARVGSARTPHRRGGGSAFGPKPRDYSFHLPQKIVDYGFRSALAAKYAQNELLIVPHESLRMESHKTRVLYEVLQTHYPDQKLLIIDTLPPYKNFFLASRTFHTHRQVQFMAVDEPITAYHLLDNRLLILTERAVEHYAKTLSVP